PARRPPSPRASWSFYLSISSGSRFMGSFMGSFMAALLRGVMPNRFDSSSKLADAVSEIRTQGR
ncbi:MAG: hypothetical protein O7F76_00410, partial [Planctomycetota bacterium]|nr:hypothetical protein [Planctomycetota bacterium]